MKMDSYKKELAELAALRKRVENSLANAPAGKIRAEMSKGKYPQYYYLDDKESRTAGRYLRKNERELARACVQKEYDNDVLDAIKKREKEIRILSNATGKACVKNVYDTFTQAKKCLITPYVLSDEDYVTEWLQRKSFLLNSIPITNSFITEQGETVRSKSEKMIADKLCLKGIPYKYEACLKLKGDKVIFPDFTLLNVSTREEVYLEHFGMMDNPEYCKKALEKIDLYEESGIILGEKLFACFESSMKPINLKSIEHLIEKCKISV